METYLCNVTYPLPDDWGFPVSGLGFQKGSADITDNQSNLWRGFSCSVYLTATFLSSAAWLLSLLAPLLSALPPSLSLASGPAVHNVSWPPHPTSEVLLLSRLSASPCNLCHWVLNISPCTLLHRFTSSINLKPHKKLEVYLGGNISMLLKSLVYLFTFG